MKLEAGARLGHYRIIALLGQGGMADVYRAEDERLGREVALKAVPPEFARDPERVERFEREVRAAARLTHPNIVTVYEFGQGAGQHFYTMALMPGGDLKVRIRAHPDGMPAAEARAVAAAMARALDYAHRQGFVHRDVKPENILFGEDGAPQLTDFGIARAMSSGTRMTATGMSIGSPHYMSPEQARGQTVDGRSDLYSLGVVLYEMLTGRVPFDAADTLAVAYAHVNDPVPELPPAQQEWQPVVDRLLAKSPEDRFGNAADLAKILASDSPPQAPATRVMPTGRDLGSPARPQEPATRLADAPNPQRKTLVAVAGGALLALAVVGIGYVALQDAAGPERQSPTGGGSNAAVQPAPIPTLPSDPRNPFDVEDREEEPSNDGGADAEVRAPEPSPPPAPQPTPSPPPPASLQPPSPPPAAETVRLFSEDFESYRTGSLPEDFVIVFNGRGTGAQRLEADGGNRHLRTAGQGGWSLTMRQDFDFDLPEAVSVSWRMRVDEDLDNYGYTDPVGARYAHFGGFGVKNTDERTASIGINKYASDRKIVAYCPEGDGRRPELQLGVWSNFRMDVDFETGLYSMHKDGEKFCETETGLADLSGRWNSWGQSSGIHFSSGNSGGSVTRFDDIMVHTLAP